MWCAFSVTHTQAQVRCAPCEWAREIINDAGIINLARWTAVWTALFWGARNAVCGRAGENPFFIPLLAFAPAAGTLIFHLAGLELHLFAEMQSTNKPLRHSSAIRQIAFHAAADRSKVSARNFFPLCIASDLCSLRNNDLLLMICSVAFDASAGNRSRVIDWLGAWVWEVLLALHSSPPNTFAPESEERPARVCNVITAGAHTCNMHFALRQQFLLAYFPTLFAGMQWVLC